MKNRLALATISLVAILCLLSGCGETTPSTDDTSDTSSISGITELKFATLTSPLKLEAGDTKTGYFSVNGNENFSIDDIEFVSSDSSVATFTYDKTALTTCVYYTITGISAGTTEIYAQTKDGAVSTEKISVTVSGFSYDIASVDDNSLPNAKRNSIRVTVAESLVAGKTDEQIQSLMEYIVHSYSEAHKLNAIQLLLFIEGDDTTGAATVGYCTYAPYGDISRASEVTAGDYTTFEFCDIKIYSEDVRDALRGK